MGKYDPMEEVKKWANSSSGKEGITFVRFLLKRLEDAEANAAESTNLLRALTAVEEYQGYCPWCGRYVITKSHQDACSWLAAAAYLRKDEPLTPGHATDCKCETCGKAWLAANLEG